MKSLVLSTLMALFLHGLTVAFAQSTETDDRIPPPLNPKASITTYGNYMEVAVNSIPKPSMVRVSIGRKSLYEGSSGDRVNLIITLPLRPSTYYCHHSFTVSLDHMILLSQTVGTVTSQCLPPIDVHSSITDGFLEIELHHLKKSVSATVYLGREKVAQGHFSDWGLLTFPRPVSAYYCHLPLKVYVEGEMVYYRKRFSLLSDQCHRRILGKHKHTLSLEHFCGPRSSLEVHSHFENKKFRVLKFRPGTCSSLAIATHPKDEYLPNGDGVIFTELNAQDSRSIRCGPSGLEVLILTSSGYPKSFTVIEPINWWSKNVTCRW